MVLLLPQLQKKEKPRKLNRPQKACRFLEARAESPLNFREESFPRVLDASKSKRHIYKAGCRARERQYPLLDEIVRLLASKSVGLLLNPRLEEWQ